MALSWWFYRKKSMLKSHFMIAWRVLERNKVYAAVNVLSLALGICACIVIGTIAKYEFSFDRHQPNRDRIYQVVSYRQITNDDPVTVVPIVPPELPAIMATDLPGAEKVAPYHLLPDATVNIPEAPGHTFMAKPIVAGPEYFSIMHYSWLVGSPEIALTEPFKVVLTEKSARLYFGPLSPEAILGRRIVYNDSVTVSVAGIIKDWSHNTDFPFTDFISISTARQKFLAGTLGLDTANAKDIPYTSRVLLKLAKGVDAKHVNASLTSLFNRSLHPKFYSGAGLQRLSEIHFAASDSDAGIRTRNKPTLYILMAISVFILLLAIINYVNLATAQSISRDKEISIRKVLGSSRTSIILQFLSETLVLTLLAIVLASLFVQPVLSAFRTFIPEGVHFDPLEFGTLFFLLCITIITTLLAGIYPARLLSSSRPKLSLQNAAASRGSEKWWLRRALIVFQFTVSLAFIIGSLVIGRQIHFMLHTDPGFHSDAIGSVSTNESGNNMERVKLIESALSSLPGVSQVARQDMPPMGMDMGITTVQYAALPDQKISVQMIKGDENYIPLYKIRLLSGRNLLPSDTMREVVVNESLSRLLGFTEPEQAIGKMIFTRNKIVPIVGVVADFHKSSFREVVKPLLITGMACTDLAIRLETKNRPASEARIILSRVQEEWKNFYPHTPFEFSFLDDEIAQLYRKEQTTSWLMKIAMGITLFICCIGVFGLTMFTAQRKTKEIGIRKVLGASISDILVLMGKDFMYLVLFALIIASPIAWLFMNRWLQDFAYRISFGPDLFLLSGAALLAVTLITVSWYSLKAARSNPVNSLKVE